MYKIEIRELCIRVYHKLGNFRATEKFLNISKSSICRWTKDIKPKIKKSTHNNPLIIQLIKDILSEHPLITINDIQKRLNFMCSYNLIRCIMKKELNLSYKKTKYQQFTNKSRLKEQTNLFCSDFKNTYNSNKLIACIDEVGFSSMLYPLYSWSKKGETLRHQIKLDTKNIKNKSVCSCITSAGNMTYKINNSPYNKESFLSFIKTLKLPKHTLIFLDNVRFHHNIDVKKYAEKKLLYIPPYSPWFNAIENIFGIIKHHYRKHKDITDAFNIIKSETIIKCINSTTENIINGKFLL